MQMAQYNIGVASVELPPSVASLPEKAGHLTPVDAARLPKPRRSVGSTAMSTADAIRRHSDRLTVPGVTADALEAAARAADEIDGVVADIEALHVVLKQANLLLDAEAHTLLRRVLAHVRSAEKFDPRITDLVPSLVRYFENAPAEKPIET